MNPRRKVGCTSARTAGAWCTRSQASSDWSVLHVTRINSKKVNQTPEPRPGLLQRLFRWASRERE